MDGATAQEPDTADDEPVLPETSRDERGQGWGSRDAEWDSQWDTDRESGRDEDWYRRERPPHHG